MSLLHIFTKAKRDCLKQTTRTFFICSVATFALATNASAQSTETNEASTEDEQIEQIEVRGVAGDAAMRAFLEGNFALAEIKFKDNALCAKRVESDFQSFVEGAQNTQINQQLAGTESSIINGRNANAANSNSGAVTSSSNSGLGTQESEGRKVTDNSLTCENRGFQLYMTGMSQLQMGRSEEAEEQFKRAIVVNKNLYDPIYRLALMHLLRDENEAASDYLDKIQGILKRCRRCSERDDIVARVDFLEKAISGEVKIR